MASLDVCQFAYSNNQSTMNICSMLNIILHQPTDTDGSWNLLCFPNFHLLLIQFVAQNDFYIISPYDGYGISKWVFRILRACCPWLGFTPFLRNCGRGRTIRTASCLKAVVGGKQGCATCEILSFQ